MDLIYLKKFNYKIFFYYYKKKKKKKKEIVKLYMNVNR